MCGRYTHVYTWKQLHRLLEMISQEVTIASRYNVAPTDAAPVVMFDDECHGASLRLMRWGLVPRWAKRIDGKPLIIARSDGIHTRASFRTAFQRRRCVVPVSGFYEWKKIDGEDRSQPYYVTPPVDSLHEAEPPAPWLIAGIWEMWHDPSLPEDAPPLESFAVVTTDANDAMRPIHHRMPVLVGADEARRWIDPATKSQETFSLLAAGASAHFTFQTVGLRVNNPKFDGPECIQPVQRQEFGSIFDRRE